MQFNNTSSGIQNINHGRDQNIRNYSVNVINPGQAHPRPTTLWDAVAGLGASHDAEQQFSRGYCLPGTREQAIAAIHEWRAPTKRGEEEEEEEEEEEDDDSIARHGSQNNPPICWVTGSAGVGKTIIAMTVAKACAENESLAASFFFFRSDHRRNNPSLLFLSIAYGLTTSIPSLRRVINERVASDPRILEAQLEEQFRELVLKPALELASYSSTSWFTQFLSWIYPQESPSNHHPNLVVIDGLDECDDSETQLRILSVIFSAFETSPYPPLRFLICSRPEAWIREALYSERFHPLAKHITLDSSFPAAEDIEKYLLHEFHDIATSPRYSHIVFPDPWPSRDVVTCLVRNSSGQFIYVVTVVKWIRADGFHPFEQLRIILKQSPKQGLSSPYRELDNIYHIILSVHPDPETLQQVLAAILFLPSIPNLPPPLDTKVATPEFIEWVLRLPRGQVFLTLRSLHSILSIGGYQEQIRILHASFSDFLCDESRSGDFFLDPHPALHFFLRQWLQNLIATCYERLNPAYSDDQLLPLSYYQLIYCRLWEGWLALAQYVPGAPTEVLSDLETLDLSALLTMALPIHGETDFSQCEWYKMLQILEKISSWLETRDHHGDSNAVQNAVNRLKTARKHFHIAVPANLATRTLLDDLSTWMSIDVDLSFHPMIGRAFDSVRHCLALSRQSSEWKILIDTDCTCPPSVLHSSREATTPVSNSDSDSRYARFHVNIAAACVSALETLTTYLLAEIDSGMTFQATLIVLDVIRSPLVSRCPPGDPRALSLFLQFLSLATSLKRQSNRRYISIPSSLGMKTKAWLETFSEEYREEVVEVWTTYSAIAGLDVDDDTYDQGG